jgi:hypothetical protein
MIGTFCIHYRLPLLHDDRDFDPMVKFLQIITGCKSNSKPKRHYEEIEERVGPLLVEKPPVELEDFDVTYFDVLHVGM